MGAVLSESLSAPLDYFLPVRVLDSVQRHFSFPYAAILFKDPQSGEETEFAAEPKLPPADAQERSSYPLGSAYRLELLGISGAEKTLSFLGASLGSRMDASRALPFAHTVSNTLSPSAIAQAAADRFRDSQSLVATLCELDANALMRGLAADYPSIAATCLRTDVLRLLSSYFEAAGRLYLSDSDCLIGLCCASAPSDRELLERQLGKYLRKFLPSPTALSIRILRSRSFMTPDAASMENFVRGKEGASP